MSKSQCFLKFFRLFCFSFLALGLLDSCKSANTPGGVTPPELPPGSVFDLKAFADQKIDEFGENDDYTKPNLRFGTGFSKSFPQEIESVTNEKVQLTWSFKDPEDVSVKDIVKLDGGELSWTADTKESTEFTLLVTFVYGSKSAARKLEVTLTKILADAKYDFIAKARKHFAELSKKKEASIAFGNNIHVDLVEGLASLDSDVELKLEIENQTVPDAAGLDATFLSWKLNTVNFVEVTLKATYSYSGSLVTVSGKKEHSDSYKFELKKMSDLEAFAKNYLQNILDKKAIIAGVASSNKYDLPIAINSDSKNFDIKWELKDSSQGDKITFDENSAELSWAVDTVKELPVKLLATFTNQADPLDKAGPFDFIFILGNSDYAQGSSFDLDAFAQKFIQDEILPLNISLKIGETHQLKKKAKIETGKEAQIKWAIGGTPAQVEKFNKSLKVTENGELSLLNEDLPSPETITLTATFDYDSKKSSPQDVPFLLERPGAVFNLEDYAEGLFQEFMQDITAQSSGPWKCVIPEEVTLPDFMPLKLNENGKEVTLEWEIVDEDEDEISIKDNQFVWADDFDEDEVELTLKAIFKEGVDSSNEKKFGLIKIKRGNKGPQSADFDLKSFVATKRAELSNAKTLKETKSFTPFKREFTPKAGVKVSLEWKIAADDGSNTEEVDAANAAVKISADGEISWKTATPKVNIPLTLTFELTEGPGTGTVSSEEISLEFTLTLDSFGGGADYSAVTTLAEFADAFLAVEFPADGILIAKGKKKKFPAKYVVPSLGEVKMNWTLKLSDGNTGMLAEVRSPIKISNNKKVIEFKSNKSVGETASCFYEVVFSLNADTFLKREAKFTVKLGPKKSASKPGPGPGPGPEAKPEAAGKSPYEKLYKDLAVSAKKWCEENSTTAKRKFEFHTDDYYKDILKSVKLYEPTEDDDKKHMEVEAIIARLKKTKDSNHLIQIFKDEGPESSTDSNVKKIKFKLGGFIEFLEELSKDLKPWDSNSSDSDSDSDDDL